MAESRPTLDALPVGYRLDDYRIVEVLGKGGFGITYKAVDERLEREVALKEYLPRDYAFRGDASRVVPRGDEEKSVFDWGLARFVDEARALALFRHPNIVSVLRYFDANGTAYLVMDYEEGEDLERWLARHRNVTDAQLVDDILMPLLNGLEKVHAKQLLHRDIKPGNIFIRADGTPLLIDFGASRAHGPQATTTLTTIVSANYSPLEQYGGGNVRQGPWTDLYALAGTMYRVIAGSPPADAIARVQGQALVPAAEVGRGRYSQRVLAAIDRALALETKDRPQSVAEFRVMIRGNADEPTRVQKPSDATVTRPVPMPAPAPDVAQKERRTAPLNGALAALLLVIGGAGGYFLFGPGKSGDASSPVETVQSEATEAPEIGSTEPPVAHEMPTTHEVTTPAVGEKVVAQNEYDGAWVAHVGDIVSLSLTTSADGSTTGVMTDSSTSMRVAARRHGTELRGTIGSSADAIPFVATLQGRELRMALGDSEYEEEVVFTRAEAAAAVSSAVSLPVAGHTSRNVVINGRRLNDADLAALEATYGVHLPDNDFWYDAVSGAWGVRGGPTLGFSSPGLALGGPLQADASGGGTGVFVNGRELHPIDLGALQSLTGLILPGRYFITAQGLAGYEGGPVQWDLRGAMARAQNAASNPTNTWQSSVTGASGFSDGETGAVFLPDGQIVSYGQ